MSSYRSNAAPPSTKNTERKRKAVVEPDDSLPAKRQATAAITQPAVAIAIPTANSNATDETSTQEYDVDVDVESADLYGTRVDLNSPNPNLPGTDAPWIPQSAKPNYIRDPFMNYVGIQWYYSNSMKGWIRSPCLICGEFLTKGEMQATADQRNGIPEPMARDTRQPPAWKSRNLPICNGCSGIARARLQGNPQNYNGKGSTIWTYLGC